MSTMLSVGVVAVESEISEVAATEMESVPETTGVSKAASVVVGGGYALCLCQCWPKRGPYWKKGRLQVVKGDVPAHS